MDLNACGAMENMSLKDVQEWIDRVADEVEEKRPQKMQALGKPEGSTEGISYLTTGNVYDWGKKQYQLGGCVSVKRWRRRSRLVKRNLPGQRVGAKAYFDFFTQYHPTGIQLRVQCGVSMPRTK